MGPPEWKQKRALRLRAYHLPQTESPFDIAFQTKSLFQIESLFQSESVYFFFFLMGIGFLGGGSRSLWLGIRNSVRRFFLGCFIQRDGNIMSVI